jgi:hypothetical protein
VKTWKDIYPADGLNASFLYVPLPRRWQVNVKWNRNSLFSERNGHRRSIRIGALRFTLIKCV